MYIGTERGVYYRDTVMASWVNFNTGFPVWADVTDLDIYYSPRGSGYSTLTASTYGRGVWRSNLYEDGSVAPIAGFYAFDSVFVVDGKMKLYEQVKNSASSFTWKITPYLYSYVDGTDSTSANPVIKFNASGLFTVKLTVSNCQSSASFTKANWVRVFKKPANPVCFNTTNFQTVNYAIGILRFNLADNSTETGTYFDDGQNLDLSSQKIFRLKPSTSYTANSRTGLYNNEYFRVFIDYNNNGRFENYLGEAVASSTSSLGAKSVSFTTPSTLQLNQGLRMRIISDYNALDTNACRNLGYGQGEDYTIVYEKMIPYFKASKLSACTYENLTFTDTSVGLIGQWDWDFGTGAVPATASGKGPHVVYYTSTGTKNVRLRINGLDSVRKNSYLTISSGPIPQIVLKSGTAAGCVGRSITLAARATNGVPFTVQWQKNGVDISGKTDTVLTLTNVSLADSGNYFAVLTNGSCVATSPAFKITNYPKPVVSFTENANPQCFRLNKFIFSNTTTIVSGSVSAWLWKLGDGTTAATQNTTKTYAAVNSYTVKLIATSDKGCIDSTSKTETVNYSATPKFTVNDSDQCLSGNSFVFTNASSITSGSLSYQWQFGDATTSTATSPTKSYSSSAFYTARLITTSSLGCKDTATKPIRVYSQPGVSYTLNKTAQCFRYNKFVFTNTSSNIDGTMSYLWKYGNGATSTTASPTYKYPVYGNYTSKLIVTTSYGCVDSSSQALNVYPQANLKFTVNDTDQCLSGNNFQINNNSTIATGTLSWNWNFGDLTTSTSNAPSKTYSSPAIYTITLISTSDKGCADTTSKPIRVYSQPQVSFIKNATAQCLKINNFFFTNTSTNVDGALNYKWNFGDGTSATTTNASKKYNAEGNYTVKLIASSVYGCADSNSQSIAVYPQSAVKFTVNDTDQCLSGNNFIFNNKTSISSGTNTYAWNFGDNQTSSIASPAHTYTFFGNYNVRLIALTNFNCRDTAYKNIRVYGQPNTDFSINKTPQCLKGNSFLFSSLSSNQDGSFTESWDFGNGQKSSAKNPVYAYNTAGNYTVKLFVNTQYGCRDSIGYPVTVYPKAVVKFTVNDSDQCLSGNQFVFNNKTSISAGTINGYTWKFGDGNQSNNNAPTQAYKTSGIFNVLLIANSNGICIDSATKPIRVYAMPVAGFNITSGVNQCLKFNNFQSQSTAVSAEGNLSVNWLNGDGSFGNGLNNAHHYLQFGSFTIKQIANSSYGCKDSIQKTIVVNAMPQPNFLIDKPIHCEKETVLFTNQSTIANGTMTYNWSFGQGQTANTTNASSSYANYGNYNILLVAISDKNCRDSFVKSTQIASIPIEKISADPKRGCANQTLFKYTDSTINPDGTLLKHYWNFGDGKQDSGKVVNHLYKNTGNYTITLLSKSPYCQASAGYSQKVDPTVFASFVSDTINKETRRFFALDTANKGYTYRWVFEDGLSNFGNPVTHKYLSNDKFKVRLFVYNSIGCSDSSQNLVNINSPNYKMQDNAFNFYIYPNPTNSSFTYKFEIKEKRSLEVKLYDILGQMPLWEKVWQDIEPGTYYETVNLKTLGFSPGIYPFVIYSGNDKFSTKIIYSGK
jgi:PKD repeat protein